MKTAAYITGAIGFFLIAGTAGSSDFYEECRAAADCVAGEPMSTAQFVLQSVAGVLMMAVGFFAAIKEA